MKIITEKQVITDIKRKYKSACNFVTCKENDILFVEFSYFTINTLTRKFCRYYPTTKLFILVK